MEVLELKRELINLILTEMKVKCQLNDFSIRVYDRLLEQRPILELEELLHKFRNGEI